jgi:hypothetical protein
MDVVLESAWLPVMLVEVGNPAWARSRVEILVRHRFAELYAIAGESVDGWQVLLDHRPGDAQTLGFGLAPQVRQAVLGALASAGVRAASLQPALAWARRQLLGPRRSPRAGWWTWIEQDRALVCQVDRGRITAMNPAAAVPRDDAHAASLAALEAIRFGLPDEGGASVMASWAALAASVVEESAPATPLQTPTTI